MAKGLYPKIDILRAKVDRGTRITIDEACFIIWAELGACSTVWMDFKVWCRENKINKTSKFTWEIWKGIYLGSYHTVSQARLDAQFNALMNKI